MVTKKTPSVDKETKKGRLKVGKLKLNKETLRDLTNTEAKKIQGGVSPSQGENCSNPCGPTVVTCAVQGRCVIQNLK